MDSVCRVLFYLYDSFCCLEPEQISLSYFITFCQKRTCSGYYCNFHSVFLRKWKCVKQDQDVTILNWRRIDVIWEFQFESIALTWSQCSYFFKVTNIIIVLDMKNKFNVFWALLCPKTQKSVDTDPILLLLVLTFICYSCSSFSFRQSSRRSSRL